MIKMENIFSNYSSRVDEIIVDKTASVHPNAQINKGVVIGKGAIIGPDVIIDSGTYIGPNSVIQGKTSIESSSCSLQYYWWQTIWGVAL